MFRLYPRGRLFGKVNKGSESHYGIGIWVDRKSVILIQGLIMESSPEPIDIEK
jgi:hypothetical protein